MSSGFVVLKSILNRSHCSPGLNLALTTSGGKPALGGQKNEDVARLELCNPGGKKSYRHFRISDFVHVSTKPGLVARVRKPEDIVLSDFHPMQNPAGKIQKCKKLFMDIKLVKDVYPVHECSVQNSTKPEVHDMEDASIL
ncbi:Hypothetical predicted protein [Paramuricea clavata]|uniref:Uncharacterized protein n=1 Tax=Paramuricea clavata TaxID=317549 RepID=A0A6S7IRL9_PARCT|nr:Hypothetical predicted protein [Paramuricea clavata]